MNGYNRGSEWKRWDLHIHTPGTKRNDCFTGNNVDEKWDNYYEHIKKYIGDGTDDSKSIAVMGVTDYLCIENYKKLIANKNRLPDTVKLILPNVELRVTPMASESPINIHCIFNPSLINDIEDLFFSKLSFMYLNQNYTATKRQLIKLGKKYQEHKNLSDLEALKVGLKQYVISAQDLLKVFENNQYLKDNTIIVVSNKSTDGASGINAHKEYISNDESSLGATRQSIYQLSNMIFSSNEKDIKYFTGNGVDSKEEVIRKCGSLKPCIHGSDAHELDKIFKPDQDRFCWIKADPTFEGLKQVCLEPEQRVRISPIKPETKMNYNVIDSVVFNDNDFQTEPIYFNDKLNCIIGGKSTGKSILIQNMAKVIDEDQTKKSLGISKHTTKNDIEIKVNWKDGLDLGRKIIYIPQTYLNQLSDNKEKQTELDGWVENIVLKKEEVFNGKVLFDKKLLEAKNLMSQKILNIIATNNELIALDKTLLELGNIDAINSEIVKMNDEKSKLLGFTGIAEESLNSYNQSHLEINKITDEIHKLEFEKINLRNMNMIAIEIENTYNFSECIFDDITKIKSEIINNANKQWLVEKENLLVKLSNKISNLILQKEKHIKIVQELKDSVEKNVIINELSKKLQLENDKLKKIKKLYDLKINHEKIFENLIEEITEQSNSFLDIHQEFCKLINENFGEKDNLLFKAESPFRSEEYINKLKKCFHYSRADFKKIIDLADFTCEKFTADFIKDIIIRTLDGTLNLKTNYTSEGVLLEILTNFYNIVYRVEMDNDPIEYMSPGKKALVMLKILISLEDSKCPILIDQPEDDLDNRSIYTELIGFIKEKKIERQIVLVTHNANIVVGSDAENIIIANQEGANSDNNSKRFEYRNGAIENIEPVYMSDGTVAKGILNEQGIQQHICEILEGGETAFKIRKKKYSI